MWDFAQVTHNDIRFVAKWAIYVIRHEFDYLLRMLAGGAYHIEGAKGGLAALEGSTVGFTHKEGSETSSFEIC